MLSTSQQSHSDAILRPDGPETGVSSPTPQVASEKFLYRESPSEKCPTVDQILLQSQDQVNPRQDAFVRLPDLRLSPLKVIVLQRWIGRVESVHHEQFVAVTTDATNPRNPPEEAEFDLTEVSEGDLPLVSEGAMFYWSIGYRDSPGGQRERVSSLRFVRSPRLSEPTVNRIFERADRMAAFLQESD
jgi:hypothetical protein